MDEAYVTGGPLKDYPTVSAKIHKICLRIWYQWEGEKCVTGPQFGQTEFVGQNKNGVFTDEEHAKKSVTDALTKCASSLEVSSDIFLGMFDDQKYVKGLKEKYAEENGDKEKSGYTPDKKTMSKSPLPVAF